MEDNNDILLFKGIRNNDYHSFNCLFEKYYGRLCAFVYDYTNSKAWSEDIIQELFIKLWNNRRTLHIDESVSAYLFRAARNMSLNHIRSEKNRKRTIENIVPEVKTEHDSLVAQEFISFVEECIEKLPERSRLVFKMSRFEGLKQKEISEQLGISVKTIKNQIWRSLLYLKSCLELKDAI